MIGLTLVLVAGALETLKHLDIEEVWRQVAVYLAICLGPAFVIGWIGGMYQRAYSKLRQV